MPLPLPNLDTRNWNDLVDEGRALIPRYAPAWTDHNIHDPGITLMELLAWLVEQDVYRVNRVPERHRRKFLALVGYAPRPPQPARVPLTFTLQPGEPALELPPDLAVATGTTTLEKRIFQTMRGLTVVPSAQVAIQTEIDAVFTDRTRLWRDGVAFPLLGEDPAAGDAVYFGFEGPLPPSTAVSLWFWWLGERTGQEERARILAEAEESFTACQPVRPITRPCPGAPVSPPATPPSPQHHTVETVWEYFDGADWQPVDAEDDTFGLTLDGRVVLTLPGPMAAGPIGVIPDPHFYLRWRLTKGRPDAAPWLRSMSLNTVEAAQTSPARSALEIAPGTTPPAGKEPMIGSQQRLELVLDAAGRITSLAVTADEDAPAALIIDYQPATPADPGLLTSTLHEAGQGDGHPHQQIVLRDAPIADGQAALWTVSDGDTMAWQQRPDLDASHRTDADFSLDASSGLITFGDGERGQVPAAGAHILTSFHRTDSAEGNVPAPSDFYLSGADDSLNAALLGTDVASVAARISQIRNLIPADGGRDEESVSQAAGRAAEFLWVHERLVELCSTTRCATLDQLDRDSVMSRLAPPRATTLLDFERLALEVPGTQVQRVRAWAGIDATLPCLQAPGTVTVVIVPALPAGRPEPTPGLLATIHRYLHRRRVLGTRLVVTGPDYLEVSVQATVQAKAGVDPDRVQRDLIAGLDRFLDPISGGPNGRGWPFGRDVYRSEILQVIDNIAGVDHVLALNLVGDAGEPQCNNLCVGITGLVAPGTHMITVKT